MTQANERAFEGYFEEILHQRAGWGSAPVARKEN